MSTICPVSSLEVHTVFTPLGIRFWDPVFDRPVVDALAVTARPAARRQPVVEAFRTRSGIYAFQGLSGLETVEFPGDGNRILTSPPLTESYILTVSDRQRRFVPVAFRETLPLPYQGIYPSDAPSSLPDESPPGFYLFSSPTRSVGPGIAVVRADLVDQRTGAPAAHALLTVQFDNGEPWYGLADTAGRVAIHFPYPTFSILPNTSPPSGPPPNQQSWPLKVDAFYAPESLSRLDAVDWPDFRTIITQAPALIHPTQNPNDALSDGLSAALDFGQELVLRSNGLATLLISPADSLP